MRSLTLLSFVIFLPVHGLIPSAGFGGGCIFLPSPPSPPGFFSSFILSCMLIGLSETAGLLPEGSCFSPSVFVPTGLRAGLPRNFPGTGTPLPFISEGLGNLFSEVLGGLGERRDEEAGNFRPPANGELEEAGGGGAFFWAQGRGEELPPGLLVCGERDNQSVYIPEQLRSAN